MHSFLFTLFVFSAFLCAEVQSMALVQRGQTYRNLYEWDRALADFDAAIELAPTYAPAYFERGLLYYSVLQTGQDLRDEALADFQRYLELAPDGEYAAQVTEYIRQIEAASEVLTQP